MKRNPVVITHWTLFIHNEYTSLGLGYVCMGGWPLIHVAELTRDGHGYCNSGSDTAANYDLHGRLGLESEPSDAFR